MSGCNGCYSGCYNPCYSYGYNTCNPYGGPFIINFSGCICLKNIGALPKVTDEEVTVTIQCNNGGTSTTTYTGTTSIPAGTATLPGGGAVFTTGGCCCSCSGPCNNLCITATVTSPSITATTFTLTGCCGGTLTGSKASGGDADVTGMTLNTTKRSCGGCTTCCITGGVIEFNAS